MSDFQTQVNIQIAPAVAGDFASTNPRASVIAGPGSLVSGPAGLTIGAFAWMDVLRAYAANTPPPGSSSDPDGFVGRQSNMGFITTFLGSSTMVIPKGMPVTIHNGGDFWVKNDSSAAALPGQKVYARLADGLATAFAAAGTAVSTGGTASTGSIAAGAAPSSASSTISGTVFTTGASVTNSFVPGTILTGSNVVTGTTIVAQLTGTTGKAGTYEVNIPQTVASTTISGSFGVFTPSGTITGGFYVGDILSSTTITTGTQIWGYGTGTAGGNSGTYYVSPSQTATGAATSATSTIETSWYCESFGAPGELVKISSAVSP